MPEPLILPSNSKSQNHSKKSFTEVISGQKPLASKSSIAVTKVLQRIYKLLASTKECKDPITKDAIINIIM